MLSTNHQIVIMSSDIISKLAIKTDSKIIMFVLDGLGGLGENGGETALEAASTPNLDRMARSSDLGMTSPLGMGITAGSGPAHFALFGYDGIKNNIGRGLLSALGLDFDVKSGDLCVRLNLCEMNGDKVVDRRAGRISTEENKKIIAILQREIYIEGVELFWLTEKAHRTVLILRGLEFSEDITDSDPQHDDLDILKIKGDQNTSNILNDISDQIRKVLENSDTANGAIMRGYALHRNIPNFQDKYKLKALALADYPMYRGLAGLVGMDTKKGLNSPLDYIDALNESKQYYNFFFVHFKAPDAYGEDGNFDAKKESIEEIDRYIGSIMELGFNTVIVCGDHSTPAVMSGHSFHSVPFMIHSKLARRLYSPSSFCERECMKGELGVFPSKGIMSLAMAYSEKLRKFGA